MAFLDPAITAEIKARIDIIDLMGEYGIDLRRAGASAKACCPFHKEKTPSFHVSSERGFYKCFGCGEHGDIFTFVQKFEGIPFPEAVRKLADRAGVKIEERYDPQAKVRARLYQINQEAAAFYRRCLLQTREAQAARDYLDSRGLFGEIAERFQIGYAPDRQGALLEWAKRHDFAPDELVAAGLLAPPRRPGDAYYDRFHGRITFPICDAQGRVIAFSCRLLKESKYTGKYVNSPETEIFKKATTLYAYHLARGPIAKAVPRRAVICEGQVDVIRCHACGFSTAVASQGTAFTAEHVTLLKRCADTADLVFDGDKAGIKAAIRTMGLFLAAGMPIRVASLPPGEDPDSLLRMQGSDAFQALLNTAEDPGPYLVKRLKEQEDFPETMEATVRIARAAVAAVADCPEPVLTARFLQDAASALNLPVSTLESDLETLRADAAEAARRREEFAARQAALAGNPPPAPKPREPIDTVEDYSDVGLYDPLEDDTPVYDEDLAEPAFAPQLIDLEAAHNLAGALCELLAHSFADPEVMSCLIRHLPPAFVHNPYAAKLYDLAIAATLAKAPRLSPPADDPEFTAYLAKLFALPDRLAADAETTPEHFARDLVKAYWIREYDRRSALLDPASPEAFLLAQSKKRLQTLSWEAAAPFMDALNPSLSAAPVSRPPAPAARPPEPPETSDAADALNTPEPAPEPIPADSAFDAPDDDPYDADIYDTL